MRKVGIVTIHFSANYGAALQSYALRAFINSLAGIKAEVLNFIPDFSEDSVYFASGKKGIIERNNKTKAFRYKETGIGTEPFSGITADVSSKFDCFIAGSDQIWNYNLFRMHEHYFLDFAPSNTVRIAYAPSIGKSTANLTMREKEIFRRFIPKFDFLSARERSCQEFLSQFTNKEVVYVLDPTMLLSVDSYNMIAQDPDKKERYLLFYFVGGLGRLPQVLSLVNRVSREYELKILHSFDELPKYAVKNETESYESKGPDEFLGLVKNAEIVITNSYHGTLFSILFEKPFYSFVNRESSTRVSEILDELRLSSRVVDGYKPLRDVSCDVDFTEAHNKLDALRGRSIEFLKEALA